MNDFIIIADSCMDLTKEQRDQFGIEYPIPGKIYFPNGKFQNADPDWGNISYEDYYKLMSNKKNVFRTSLPNEFEITTRFEEYLSKGKDILAVTLSSKVSGTYEEFYKSKVALEAKYPDRKILIVDSLRYGSAIGLLCITASRLRKEGKTVEETFNYLNEKRFCLHQAGILDDLFFLARSGRLRRFKAFMGSLVGIKPTADFSNESGMPCILGNCRGYKASYRFMMKYIKRTIGNFEGKDLIINTSMRDKQAAYINDLIKENFPNVNTFMTRVGESNGANVGPGLLCVYYLSDEKISSNCEREKKLFVEIVTE